MRDIAKALGRSHTSVSREMRKNFPLEHKIYTPRLAQERAKENTKRESDIDIYIETKDEKIKEEVKKINDLINVKTGRFDTEDLLIKEIIKNHVIIRGAEEYYEKIKFFR